MISGSDESLALVVGLIDGILHRPVEPLSFKFWRWHPHTETGGDRSRWMAARMTELSISSVIHLGGLRS